MTWRKKDSRLAVISSKRGLSSAFTLIELVVVLAVIGLIALLVFPRLGSLGLSDIRTEARRLEGITSLCFNLAVMEKTNYRLAIDLDHQCWWAEKRNGQVYMLATSDLLARHCVAQNITVQELEVLDRKQAKTGLEYIYFSPYGYVEPARVFITNDSGSGYTLFTDPMTGRMIVDPGQVEFKDAQR
jgi:prepilin-type N-terminal cleavage/methylation domain-containing protein